MMQISWTMFSILSGGIYFQEYMTLSVPRGFGYGLGVAVSFSFVKLPAITPQESRRQCTWGNKILKSHWSIRYNWWAGISKRFGAGLSCVLLTIFEKIYVWIPIIWDSSLTASVMYVKASTACRCFPGCSDSWFICLLFFSLESDRNLLRCEDCRLCLLESTCLHQPVSHWHPPALGIWSLAWWSLMGKTAIRCLPSWTFLTSLTFTPGLPPTVTIRAGTTARYGCIIFLVCHGKNLVKRNAPVKKFQNVF